MHRERQAARFRLGNIVATSGFLETIPRSAMIDALSRHAVGDWGMVDPEDAQANEQAIKEEKRILSVYEHEGERFWIVTEAGRETTTFLLPEEY